MIRGTVAIGGGRELVFTHAISTQNDFDHLSSTQDLSNAQSFVGVKGRIVLARIMLKKEGAPPGTMVSKIYAITGTPGTNAQPTGGALATSDTVSANSISTAYFLIDFPYSGANQFVMTPGTNYCISIEYSGGDSSNNIVTGYDHTASGSTNISVPAGANAGTYPGTLCYDLFKI